MKQITFNAIVELPDLNDASMDYIASFGGMEGFIRHTLTMSYFKNPHVLVLIEEAK